MVSIFCQALFCNPAIFSHLCMSAALRLHLRPVFSLSTVHISGLSSAYPVIISIFRRKVYIIFAYTTKTICFCNSALSARMTASKEPFYNKAVLRGHWSLLCVHSHFIHCYFIYISPNFRFVFMQTAEMKDVSHELAFFV